MNVAAMLRHHHHVEYHSMLNQMIRRVIHEIQWKLIYLLRMNSLSLKA